MLSIQTFTWEKTSDGEDYLSIEVVLTYPVKKGDCFTEVKICTYLIVTPETVEYHLPNEE